MYRIGTIVVVLSICSFASLAEAELKDVESTHTEITSPPSSEQPMFLRVGERLELECTDTDGSDVQWYKDVEAINTDQESGFILTSNKQTKNGHLNTYSRLVKNQVEMSDSSTYECKATIQSHPSHRMTVEVFDIKGDDVKLDTSKSTLQLQCKIEGLTTYQPLRWYRNGELIKPVAGKYRTDARNNTLTIEQPEDSLAGPYHCGFTLSNGKNYTFQINVTAVPTVRHFDKSKNLVQGDPLVLECEVGGWPTPTVSWVKKDEEAPSIPLEADNRISFSPHNDVENATLRIENMDYADRMNYICVATNSEGSVNSTVLVRVKDKLAALWPFLGICAEVTILCVIIFIYEKRRAKKMEEEDAPEEAGHLTNSHDHKGNDDIRQRK